MRDVIEGARRSINVASVGPAHPCAGHVERNQYGPHADVAVWDRCFATIREAQPACSAIGVTDYFVPRGYRLGMRRALLQLGPSRLVFEVIVARVSSNQPA